MISHSEIGEQEMVSKEIGKTWKETFDLKVKYEKLLWNSYFEKMNSQDFMLGGFAWNPRYEDLLYYFNLFIYREEAVHVTNWRNKEYNKLIEKTKETADQSKRILYLMQAEKILLDEMPVIPLFYQKFRYFKNPKLRGYILSNINQIDFRRAYFDK